MVEPCNASRRDRAARYAFIGSVAVLIFGYGFAVGAYEIFPRSLFRKANEGFLEIRKSWLRSRRLSKTPAEDLPWYYVRAKQPYPPPINNTGRAFQGVNLVTGIGPDLRLFARITDMDGRTLHTWDVDWFRIWPDAKHLPGDLVPKSRPGASIHGAVVLEDGDLIFSFPSLGMVRLNRAGEVVWRLPYRTHHTVHMDENGDLWTCGVRRRWKRDPRYPWRNPPFDEYTVAVVSVQGKLLREWSIPEILFSNNRLGLYNISLKIPDSFVGWGGGGLYKDDRLHQNDVEPFPASMEEGLFQRNDVIVSLRHVNTVFVFNQETGKIKYISTGMFVYQHDPDFVDGNTYSVFDNGLPGTGSRIAIVRASDDSVTTAYKGNAHRPFFTNIGGKHQWLPNGDLLVTDARNGRGFEVNRAGEIVWEYYNYVDEGVLGLVTEVHRLPEHYADIFR